LLDPDVIWYCLGAYGLLVVAGFGLPIPEEVVVMAAGGWVAAEPEYGPIRWVILPVCIAGILTSDIMLYSVGRYWGARLLEHRRIARLLTPERLDRIQRNFERYGTKILLIVRWVPGIRSPLFMTAGTMRLPFVRFIVADSIAAVAGHSVIFFLSYWFGQAFRDLFARVEGDVSRLAPLLIVLSILAVGVYLLIHFLRKPVSTGDLQEVPLIGSQMAAKIDPPEPEPTAPPTAKSVPADQATEQRPVP